LGFLAAAGVASVLGAVLFGALGFAVVAIGTVVLWQRRRQPRCTPAASTPVDTPTLRPLTLRR
jgi:nitrate reductase gamma subunit